MMVHGCADCSAGVADDLLDVAFFAANRALRPD